MVLFLSLLACSPDAAKAPVTLDGALLRVLTDFRAAQAVPLAEDLATLVEDEVLTAEDGVTLGAITAESVAGVAYEGSPDWDQVYGGAIARTLEGPMRRYAESVVEADQAAVIGDGYASWDRTLVEGSVSGYLAGEPLTAEDAVVKEAPFGITLPYPMRKEWLTVTTPRGEVQLMRSVIYREGWSDDRKNGIVVGFTVELWMPADIGITWFNGTWTQVVTPLGDIATPEFMVGQILGGAEDAMIGTEAWVNTR